MNAGDPTVPGLIFGSYAGLPQQLSQQTDPTSADFQESFKRTLDFANSLSKNLIQMGANGAAHQTQYSVVPWQPYAAGAQHVAEAAHQTFMEKVQNWWDQIGSPSDGTDRSAYDTLIGQARVHGIPDPESWNPKDLAAQVENSRAEGILRHLDLPFQGNPLAESAAQFGASFYHGLVGIARDIPFAGDALSGLSAVRKASQTFAGLEEYYKTEADQGGVGDLISKVGNIAAYGVASAVAWEALGAAGIGSVGAETAAASRMSKIGQLALRGGVDSWLLTGGGDKPLEDRGMNVLAGMALGGSFGIDPRVGGGLLGAVAGGTAGAVLGKGDNGDIVLGALIGSTLGIGTGSIIAYRALQARAAESFTPKPELPPLEPPVEPVSGGAGADAIIPRSGTIQGLDQLDPNIQSAPFAPAPIDLTGSVRLQPEPQFHTQLSPTPFQQEAVAVPPVGGVDVQAGTAALQPRSGNGQPQIGPDGTYSYLTQDQAREMGAVAAQRGESSRPPDAIDGIAHRIAFEEGHASVSTGGLSESDFGLAPEDFIKRMKVIASAEQNGAAIAKANTIMESPALTQAEHGAPLAQRPQFDDYDVALAQQASTPGQAFTVNDVQDPALFMRRAAENGTIPPERIRFVGGPNGLTRAVIGPEATVAEFTGELSRRGTAAHEAALQSFLRRTEDIAAQVEKHGFFEGQLVKDAQGNEGVIDQLSPDSPNAVVRGKYSEERQLVPVNELLGEPHGMEEHPQGQGFYAALRKYAESRLLEETNKTGLQYVPQWTSDEMSSQLPRYMGELFDKFGITQSERPAISLAVDKYRLGDLLDTMDPHSRYVFDTLRQDAAATFDEYVASGKKAPAILEDFAATRGFDVKYGETGRVVTLTHSRGEPVTFDNPEAARAFLDTFHAAEPALTMGVDEVVPPTFGTSARMNEMAADATSYEAALSNAEEMSRIADRMAPPEPPSGNGGGGLPPMGGGSAPQPGPSDDFVDVAGEIQKQARGRTEAYLHTIAKAQSGWSRLWEPRLYGVLQQLEEDLTGRMGIQGATPFADAQNLNIALGRAANADVEWAQRFDEAIKGISRKRIRNGDLFEVAQQPAGERAALMTQRGYAPHEMQAVERLRQFFDDARQNGVDNGIDLGYLPDYLPHLRKFAAGQMSLGDMPPESRWFAEMVREGGINSLETDVSILGAKYIRGMNRQIFAKDTYENAVAIWNDHRIPEEVRLPVANYIRDKFYGRTHVGALSRVTRDMLNTLGKPFGLKFNAADVDVATSSLIKLWYTSVLGNVQALTRDFIQPLWAATEIGPQALKEFLQFHTSGMEYKRAAIELGMQHGWVERGTMQIENADVFRAHRNIQEIGDPVLSPQDVAVRQQWRERINSVFDLLPGSPGMIDKVVTAPSRPFQTLGYANRAIPGKAGFDLATEALDKYARGEITGEDNLIKATYLDGARQPVQDQFLRLVRQGKMEDAAVWMGHYAADSQFKYGIAEAPELMQTEAGRLLAMTGTFSNQALRRYKDGLFNGSVASRVRFAAGHMAISAAIGAASEVTGIKGIKRLWWWPSIFFGGGPTLQTVADLAGSVGAVGQAMQGQSMSGDQTQSLQNLGQDFSPASFFTYRGLLRNVDEASKAVQSAHPIQELGQVFFGGRVGPKSIYDPHPGPIGNIEYLNGQQPPSYHDLNSVLNDRQRAGAMMAPDRAPIPGSGGMF